LLVEWRGLSDVQATGSYYISQYVVTLIKTYNVLGLLNTSCDDEDVRRAV